MNSRSEMKEIRQLYPYIRPYVPLLVVSLVLLALVGAIEGLIMMLIGPIFDDVLAVGPKSAAMASKFAFLYRLFHLQGDGLYLRIALALFVLTLIKCVCLYFADYNTIYVGQRVVQRVRDDMFAHILRQSMLFFAGHSTGKLMSRIVNDVDKIQDTVSRTLADFVRQVLTLAAFIVLIFYIDPLLSSISFVVVPLVAWVTSTLGRKIKGYSWHTQEFLAQLSNTIQEAISGSRVVQAFGMEKFELSRFRQATGGVFRFNMKVGRMVSLNPPLMELFGVLIFIPFLIYAHFRIQGGNLTVGSFATFLASLIRMYDPIRRLSRMHLNFEQTFASVDRIQQVLETRQEIPDPPGAAELPLGWDRVDYRGVSFHFAKEGSEPIPVLRDIDLTVRRGEILAIVGSSGAGKTTLVNLLPRFYDPTGGALLFDGQDIRNFSLASLRAQVAIVTQETFLFNDTIRNNICYGSGEVTPDQIEAAARAALAHEFIQKMPHGYDTLVGERGARVSGGERQRLAIARAILKDAPLLILDEATSSLDSESEVLVQSALANLIRNRTTFVIAHRLSTVRNAHRIIVMDQGRIEETGTHEELLENGRIYKKLYELQFQTTQEG